MNTRDYLAVHPRVAMFNPHVPQRHLTVPRVPHMDTRVPQPYTTVLPALPMDTRVPQPHTTVLRAPSMDNRVPKPHFPPSMDTRVPQAHLTTPRSSPMNTRASPSPSASMSRSYTYKKVTKPMLERRRRARMSKCYDELKVLMIGPLKMTEESLNKMEKADILEMVVDHLHNLQNAQQPNRYQEGFNECAAEACHFLETRGDSDGSIGERLAEHLEKCTGPLSIEVPSYRLTFSPPVSPVSLGTSPRSFSRQTSLQDLSSTSGLLMEASRKRSLSSAPMSIPKRICLSVAGTSQISPSCTSGYCSDEPRTPLSDSSDSMWRPW